MRALLSWAAAAGAVLSAAGCGGDGLLRTKGRLLKDGQPLTAQEGQRIEITFVPVPPAGGPPAGDYYFAVVDQTAGTFRPGGKNGQGMPPGKYRVAVEVMVKKKDQFKGKFDQVNSPFVVDVTPDTPEIVIDLAKPPAK